MRENHYAILAHFENFLRFQQQDKHNASSFSRMSWKELPQSEYKITIFSWLSLMFEPIFALCACKLSDYHTI